MTTAGRLRAALALGCALAAAAAGVVGPDVVAEGLARLTPTYAKTVELGGQVALYGYDIEAGVPLLPDTSGTVVMKSQTPFSITYYWRVLDAAADPKPVQVFFKQYQPRWSQFADFVDGEGVAARQLPQRTPWQRIGHAFRERRTYSLPDHLLMRNISFELLYDGEFFPIGQIRIDEVLGAWGTGRALAASGRMDEALADLSRFAEKATDAHKAQADSLMRLLGTMASGGVDDWRVAYCEGHAHRALGAWQPALEAWEKAGAAGAAAADAYYYRAEALKALGRDAEARAVVVEGLALDPDNVYLRGARAHSTEGAFGETLRIGPGEWNGLSAGGELYSFGAVWKDVRLYGGKLRLKVAARGKPAVDEWPRMVVEVDGRVVAEATVASRSTTVVEAEFQLETGRHRVALFFVNDVNKVNAQGQTENTDLVIEQCEIFMP